MYSLRNLRKTFKSYNNLSAFHKLFIFVRYLIVPWDKMIEKIGYSGKVLDVGSGHALFLNLLSNERPGLLCYGFEPDKNKIAAVSGQLKNTKIRLVSTKETNNFADNSFDYVTIADVLYCVSPESWKGMIDLAYRVLKPSGLFVVKETDNKPQLKYLFCLFQEYLAIKIFRYTKGSEPKLLGADYYLKAFRDGKFRLVDHYPIDKWYPYPHHLFILKK